MLTDYSRKDPGYYGFARVDLLQLAPEIQGTVLDIGCGDGATLDYLISKGVHAVKGIELFDEARKKAIEKGLEVLAIDIDKEKLPFKEKEFDYIILADILEHLYDPWTALKNITVHLKDEGNVLISIPNIKYYKILFRLIWKDSWEYADCGILDSTHLRFFTLKEAKRLVESSGLKITRLHCNFYDCSRIIRWMNYLFAGKLKTFCAYQYFMVAKKSAHAR